MDRPPDAPLHYQESLAIKREIGDPRGIAVSLNESAQAQIMLQPVAALVSYNGALKIRRSVGDAAPY